MEQIWEFISLNYTLIVVSIGTGILCMASGVVGCFTYLRKRALIGDVISHAVLPGVTIAFMLTGVKNPATFVIGAIISGLISVWAVDFIQQRSKLKPDTILALILSVFFGFGILLLTYVQGSGNAAQSGLDSFLFGKAASMSLLDVKIFSLIALLNVLSIGIFLRGFQLISFDETYAKSIGFRVKFLKSALAILTVVTVAIGVQAVGVVLMAALLISPAAGARFMTNSIKKMLLFSGIVGAVAGIAGALISSTGLGMPTGPWVVVCLSVIAFFAILFGKQKGLLSRMRLRRSNQLKINNENVLKALYKISQRNKHSLNLDQLKQEHDLMYLPLVKILRRLKRKELVELVKGRVVLSEQGVISAREVIRKHRLWELYLSKYFQLATDHLHDDAEGIEHVITPEIEKHLTELLEYPDKDPHESEIPY